MSRKRILCLIDSLASGGAQRQMIGLASLLQKKGFVVKVVTYYDIPFYRSFLINNKVDYESLRCGKGLISRLSAIKRSMKRFNPEVVISYLDTPCLLACILKRIYGNWRLIVSERNTTQKLSIREKIKFYAYRYADSIVSNSYSQDIFIANNFPQLHPKCHVITNFVETEIFKPADYKARKEMLSIIGIGRISSQKNIPILIEAVKKVRDRGHNVCVDWYGERYESYDSCISLIRQYGMEDAFKFHEPYNPIVEKYQNADLFVLPSVYEGFPNVLCEALSCGVPSIASEVCDNGRIVSDGENGFLFPSGDVNKLADTILKFIKLSDEEKKKMSDRCREIALKMFSKEAFIQQYLSLISK